MRLDVGGAYSFVSRAGIVFPSRTRKRHPFGLLSALEKDQIWNADYKLFYEWFRDQEGAENKEKLEKGKAFVDRQLDAVRQAIYTFIPSFSNLYFHWTSPQGLMVTKKDFGDFRIEQLSGGEQCLLAMVGDLARKLAIANPERINPLEGDGVVFIDEVDLHLHPTWQSSILEKLKKPFLIVSLLFLPIPHSFYHMLDPTKFFPCRLTMDQFVSPKGKTRIAKIPSLCIKSIWIWTPSSQMLLRRKSKEYMPLWILVNLKRSLLL